MVVEETKSQLQKVCDKCEVGSFKYQIGFGCTFFENAGVKYKPPRYLKPIRFNGDLNSGVLLGNDESDLLLVIGGAIDSILELTNSLVQFYEELGCIIRSTNFGYSGGSDRDHTGFRDGTSNLQELDPDSFSKCVFIQPGDDDPLYNGGFYLIYRKYEENIEMWNNLAVSQQEGFIGRKKHSGAFLNGNMEVSKDDFQHTPKTSHIRCVNPRSVDLSDENYWQQRIYRRSIKYSESDQFERIVKYGLHFVALVRNPELQIERIHNERMITNKSEKDYFMTAGYIRPLHSSCFFIPAPGTITEFLNIKT